MRDADRYHNIGQPVHTLDVHAVARALGGTVISRDSAAAPGPGHSQRDRSLIVRLDPSAPDGFVVFSHSGDDWQSCKDHVRAQLGLPQWQPGDGRDRRVEPARLRAFDRAAINAESERRAHTADELTRIERAREIWRNAVDPRGTVAEQYLQSRALVLGDDVAGAVLRFHPRCPWRDENSGATVGVPVLVAAFRSIDDDQITAVQRVALDADGKKIGRRMLGVVHRSAVKLSAASATLHVGEGVETCLAARQLGYAPAWAAGSAGAIAHFPVIDGVACLRLLGERDDANARAAELCSRRWHDAGRRVQIGLPKNGHKDFNDQLREKAS